MLTICLVISFVIPFFIINFGYAYDINGPKMSSSTTSNFSYTKDSFDPILNSPKQGLGNISVSDISFDQEGFDFLGGTGYGGLVDDLQLFGSEEPAALNISYKSTEFVKTQQVAFVQNLNESIRDKKKVTIEINETLSVQFNQSRSYTVEGYLVYTPRLYPCSFKQFYIRENPTDPSKYLNEGNYSIDEYDFVKFSYDNYFNSAETGNFTLHLIWEYVIDINEWELNQDSEDTLEIDSQISTVEPDFEYTCIILGRKYNNSELQEVPADDLSINATFNLPDKSLLNYTDILLNGISKDEEDVVNPDRSLQMEFSANNSIIEVGFNADFQVEFKNAIQDTWAVDRLISAKNIRERIFFPSIIGGPQHIYVKNLIAYDTTINYDQVSQNSTQFGRSFPYYRANITVVEEEMKNSLVFTENTTKRKGIKLILPYIIHGEICPTSLRYRAINNLRIIITDNSFMPLSDVEIKLFYYGKEYGTYMAKNRTQPLPKLITDNEGEVIVNNVPNGNYTLQVIRNNNVILETSVSPDDEINYVRTNIPHIPILGIIFGGVSAILFLVGFLLYKNYKKKER